MTDGYVLGTAEESFESAVPWGRFPIGIIISGITVGSRFVNLKCYQVFAAIRVSTFRRKIDWMHKRYLFCYRDVDLRRKSEAAVENFTFYGQCVATSRCKQASHASTRRVQIPQIMELENCFIHNFWLQTKQMLTEGFEERKKQKHGTLQNKWVEWDAANKWFGTGYAQKNSGIFCRIWFIYLRPKALEENMFYHFSNFKKKSPTMFWAAIIDLLYLAAHRERYFNTGTMLLNKTDVVLHRWMGFNRNKQKRRRCIEK